MKIKVYDPSPRTGVFVGDLAYGRRNGNVIDKHGDYPGPNNEPIVPLILVEPRDTQVWRKDPSIKEAKKEVSTHQSIRSTYLAALTTLRANIHLTIGKQRL